MVHAIHDRALADHGGSDGVRNAGMIDSALHRAPNLACYGQPDAADLAAAYAFGLVKNHGYIDGNKRVAWIAARLFLADNGVVLRFNPIEAVQMVDALAAGTLTEAQVADWFRARMAP